MSSGALKTLHSSYARACGGAASRSPQVSRLAAKTAIALRAGSVSPSCTSSTAQCWVERFERMSLVPIVKAPALIGAMKFTVSESGSPCRSWRCRMPFSAVAAVMPPNGPTKFQYLSLVWPRKFPSARSSRWIALSKGCDSVRAWLQASATLMSSLPVFSPLKSMSRVSGKVSRPSTMSSRVFSLPAFIQPAISRTASPKRLV